jgi:hypothetical protein
VNCLQLFNGFCLIPSQPVFALSLLCCVLSGEATNTNFIVSKWIDPTGARAHDIPRAREPLQRYNNPTNRIQSGPHHHLIENLLVFAMN